MPMRRLPLPHSRQCPKSCSYSGPVPAEGDGDEDARELDAEALNIVRQQLEAEAGLAEESSSYQEGPHLPLYQPPSPRVLFASQDSQRSSGAGGVGAHQHVSWRSDLQRRSSGATGAVWGVGASQHDSWRCNSHPRNSGAAELGDSRHDSWHSNVHQPNSMEALQALASWRIGSSQGQPLPAEEGSALEDSASHRGSSGGGSVSSLKLPWPRSSHHRQLSHVSEVNSSYSNDLFAAMDGDTDAEEQGLGSGPAAWQEADATQLQDPGAEGAVEGDMQQQGGPLQGGGSIAALRPAFRGHKRHLSRWGLLAHVGQLVLMHALKASKQPGCSCLSCTGSTGAT